MLLGWLTARVGPRAVRGIIVGVVVFLVWGVLIVVYHTMIRRDDPKHQVNQTTASAEAIANAATNAVETVTGRMTANQEIDAATAIAMREIENAEDSDAVRAAVIAAVCLRQTNRDDPACQLRPSNPR